MTASAQPRPLALYTRTLAKVRGAERTLGILAQGLAERGHRVDLLLEECRGALVETLKSSSDRIAVIDLAAPTKNHRRSPLGASAHALAAATLEAPITLARGEDTGITALARFMRKNKPPLGALKAYMTAARPAAILSFLNHPNIAMVLAAAQLGTAAPRIYPSVRNTMSIASAENESRWVRSVPTLMRRHFRHATRVAAPSRGVAEDVLKITGLPPERIVEIPNPVYRPELEQLADTPVDHPWFADDGGPVLVTAGKLKHQKDYPTLLKAVAEVRTSRPVRLIILGEGPDLAALKRLCNELGLGESVAFLGHVDNPYAWFKRADLFIQTSLWEGLPNALIEAMACGCPVVSSNCESGPDEILDGGRLGPLVPIGDVAGFAEAIQRTLNAPPDRAAVVERARRYSLDAALTAYEALLLHDTVPPTGQL